MRRLISKRPILYMGETYAAGRALPTDNEAMTAAWIRAGSAAWDAPEAVEVPEVPEVPEIPETPEVPETVGVSETPKAPEAPVYSLRGLMDRSKGELLDIARGLGLDVDDTRTKKEIAAAIAGEDLRP